MDTLKSKNKSDDPSGNKRVKAMLMAAGLGTRLRPITDSIPKCLVQIGGRPLLAHWLDSLEKAGIDQAIVNTHWLHEKVDDFISDWNNSKRRLSLITYYEEALLGSAGTIVKNITWASSADAIMVIYADNYSVFNLNEILNAHFNSGAEITLGVFEAADPTKCGIVELDRDGNAISFIEKPLNTKSNLAAAGIYVFSSSVLKDILNIGKSIKGVYDLGLDVFPKIINRAKVFKINDPITDIGSISAYQRICSEFNVSLSK